MARKPKLPAIQRAWLHAKLRDEGACHSHAEAAMQYAEKHSSLIAALRSLDPKKRDHRMWLRWVVGFVTTWRQLERMERPIYVRFRRSEPDGASSRANWARYYAWGERREQALAREHKKQALPRVKKELARFERNWTEEQA
jgi:hypothetical protein